MYYSLNLVTLKDKKKTKTGFWLCVCIKHYFSIFQKGRLILVNSFQEVPLTLLPSNMMTTSFCAYS